MTTPEIQTNLEEMYGTEVSPTLISSLADAMTEEVKARKSRPLDSIYSTAYLDCIHIKVRDDSVRIKAAYLVIGFNTPGEKKALGAWIAQTEGAKFWLQVITAPKSQRVQDIFVACADDLKGFLETIEAATPGPPCSFASSIWCGIA